LVGEAQQSFRKFQAALAAAGGHPPCGADGTPLHLWNERQGWHAPERTNRVAPVARSRTSPAGSCSGITRSARKIAFERDLLRTASSLAWRAARLFRHGLAPQPGLDAPAYMLVGWRLHRRGMYDPPASL
jgi:hypothetical protein